MLSSKFAYLCIILAALASFHLQLANAQITEPSEVSALQAIKKTLIDPQDNLKNWKSGDPCTSNWTGVFCFASALSDGYLHVQELALLRMNLSGTIAPEVGQLSYMTILDYMWNNIYGSIPKEIGNITSLKLLLLNGNQLNGSLPEELGNLPNLNRIQIDQNHISGPVPTSFANLNKTQHFHMNNNSLSGQIPPELSRLPALLHLLLDNNNLSGYLPPGLSQMPKLKILQLDNNNFSGSSIPATYANMSQLLKMSLRNCSLQGPVPDLSAIPQLGYLDLSFNQLTGPIPTNRLASNITTIDLSHNHLNGTIPQNFSGLPNLQILYLNNNNLTGSVPTNIWQNIELSANGSLVLDFEDNDLTNISSSLTPPANVTIMLYGNPVCSTQNEIQFGITQYCNPQATEVNGIVVATANAQTSCQPCSTDYPFEPNPLSPIPCFCGVPIEVGYRLKSPGFMNFPPYYLAFEDYLTSGLNFSLYQLQIVSYMWEEGPRLRMDLRLFPNNTPFFNSTQALFVRNMFTGWNVPDSDIFGPYELINLTLGSYYDKLLFPSSSSSGLSTGAIVGIVLASVAAAGCISSAITILVLRKRARDAAAKKRSVSRLSIKIDGVKGYTFDEMALATNNFDNSTQVGQGGYGKVYRGVLADGTLVAIKRAQQGSLQGSKEFFTEIELLSRLHHRNLVSLLGYCDEEDEQMLVYEFMPNGTLRDHVSVRAKQPLSFAMRLRIAMGSSRGILYLHNEADPPIFHRDIKASNILLDSKFVAKVADFGLSRLAPMPDGEGITPGHVSTVVKGTPGYLDPEYFLTHKLTDKSDVYSLGVVFLELLTAMQPISHGKNIVREVATAYQSGMIFSIIDTQMGSYSSECIEKFVALALQCCRDETDARPSMMEVVRELEVIMRMSPEVIDGMPSGSLASDSGKSGTLPSSSATSKMAAHGNPYVSSDVSGSDLLSGVMPSITPR